MTPISRSSYLFAADINERLMMVAGCIPPADSTLMVSPSNDTALPGGGTNAVPFLRTADLSIVTSGKSVKCASQLPSTWELSDGRCRSTTIAAGMSCDVPRRSSTMARCPPAELPMTISVSIERSGVSAEPHDCACRLRRSRSPVVSSAFRNECLSDPTHGPMVPREEAEDPQYAPRDCPVNQGLTRGGKTCCVAESLLHCQEQGAEPGAGSPVKMERRAIAVHGTVQGVGFRPFVYALASHLDLGGFVRNDLGCVWIEVEGHPGSLDQFIHRLSSESPPLARIDDLTWKPQTPRGDASFRIEDSSCDAAAGPIVVSPDIATCDDCLAELFDPFDRRHSYPFINCTNCGPRLTIVTGAPYDRQRTTMGPFELCAACRAEYEDRLNRRFHAQAIACRACGPRLVLLGPDGRPLDAADPIAYFAEQLRAGGIGALKGLGGYHLACDARNEEAVIELRRRKHRDEKPF